jgi:hypothetical protein
VQPEQLERRDRLAFALEPQGPQLPPGGDVPGAGAGPRARVDPADRGRVGQPGGGVHRVADDRVLDRGLDAGHHLAGVQADPQAQRRTAAAFVVQDPAYRTLHAQCRPDRALGVVLVRDRGAEHGHDAVTGELVDVPAEGLDRAGERGQDAVGDRADALRVQVFRPGREIREVAEQNGDDAALGGGQGGRGSQRRATVVAETGTGNGDGSTHRTGHSGSNRSGPGCDSRLR